MNPLFFNLYRASLPPISNANLITFKVSFVLDHFSFLLLSKKKRKMVAKVYGAAYASGTRRVLSCLLEKDIDFELANVDLPKREQKKPEFLDLQHFGKVPAVQDGDLTLFESRAIIRYYAEKYEGQGTSLMGKSLEERALVEQWLKVERRNYNRHASTLVFQLIFAPRMGIPQDQALIDSSAEQLGKVLDVYEERLSKTKFLAGEIYSLADLSHLPFTEFIVNATDRGYLIRERKHVNAWWEEISSRPAWRKILAM
uniref:glutathione transferase n=1 Tax=Wollemia nobilis TaxID=56998 RepID=A0A0C9RU46_9CONI